MNKGRVGVEGGTDERVEAGSVAGWMLKDKEKGNKGSLNGADRRQDDSKTEQATQRS